MPTATPPPFSLDTFHPSLLRCDRCGAAFVLPAPPLGGTPVEDLRHLTDEEIALLWPALGGPLQRHRHTCPGVWFPVETWDEMAAGR